MVTETELKFSRADLVARLNRANKERSDLLRQRDQLAAALRDLLETVERIGAPPIQRGTLCEETDWHYDVKKAHAALDNCKEAA